MRLTALLASALLLGSPAWAGTDCTDSDVVCTTGYARVLTEADSFGPANPMWDSESGGSAPRLAVPKVLLGPGETLIQADVTLTTIVNGSLAFENLSNTECDPTLRLSIGPIVASPIEPVSLAFAPTQVVDERNAHLSAFDGVNDQSGTSGVTFVLPPIADTQCVRLTDPADLGAFVAGFPGESFQLSHFATSSSDAFPCDPFTFVAEASAEIEVSVRYVVCTCTDEVIDCDGTVTEQLDEDSESSPVGQWSSEGPFATTSRLSLAKAFLGEGETLVQAEITVTGMASGGLQQENRDVVNSCTATLDLRSLLEIDPIDSIPWGIGPLLLEASFDASLAAFDGVVDFGGSSGVSLSVAPLTETRCVRITDPSILEDHFVAASRGDVLEFSHSANDLSGTAGCVPTTFQSDVSAELVVSVRYTICNASCFSVVALQGSDGYPPLTGPRTLAGLYGIRDGLLNGTPAGRRWTRLYYEHSTAIADILRERPRLRRRMSLLLVAASPGLAALARGDADLSIPRPAVALLDAVLRELEEADGGGELARAIRAERAVLDRVRMSGSSYGRVWRELNELSHALQPAPGEVSPR